MRDYPLLLGNFINASKSFINSAWDGLDWFESGWQLSTDHSGTVRACDRSVKFGLYQASIRSTRGKIMAVIIMESFGWTNSAADLAGRYNMSSYAMTVNPTGGRFNGGGMSTNSTVDWPLPTEPTEGVIGFAFECATPGFVNNILYFNGAAGTHFSLATDIEGHLQLLDNGGGVLATSGYVVNPSIWQYIEAQFIIGLPGSVEVYVDGSPVIVYVGNNQEGGSAEVTSLRWYGDTRTIAISDLYMIDSPLALGPSRVLLLKPTSDGDELNWTPSTGATHYNLVNEVPPDSAQNITSILPGDLDCYHFASLPYAPEAITAVQVSWYGETTDVTPRAIKPLLRIGGTNYLGTQQSLNTSLQDFIQIYPTNPATSAAWTDAAVNGLQAGVDQSV